MWRGAARGLIGVICPDMFSGPPKWQRQMRLRGQVGEGLEVRSWMVWSAKVGEIFCAADFSAGCKLLGTVEL